MTVTLAVTRIAHSCLIIEIGEDVFLTDPWFSDRPPIYRAGEPRSHGVAELPDLTGVLVSHAHDDHCDLAALARGGRRDVPVVGDSSVAIRASAAGMSFPRRSFDLRGALLSTVGITAVVYAVADGPELGWAEPSVLIAGLGGLVLLVAFLVQQRRATDPLLPLRLFRDRNLAVGSGVTFAFMASFGTLLYFLTLYFQLVRGYSAMETGMAFLVPMVAIAIGAQTAGRVATRFGTRTVLVTSLVVGGVGAAIVAASLSVSAGYLSLVPGLLVLGLGQGAGYTVMFGAATSSIADADQGVGSGVVSTTQQIGGAVGLAVLVAVAAPQAADTSQALVDGVQEAFWVAVVAIAATSLLALRLRRPGVPVVDEPAEPVVAPA